MTKLLLLLLLIISPICFGKVVIYTAPGCHYCDEAKDYFYKHNIKFTECSVVNLVCFNKFVALNGKGTPLIDYNGKIIDGFDEAQLDRLLNR